MRCVLALFWTLLWTLLCATSVEAGSANASALSDPAGLGRPRYDENPFNTDLSIRFLLHGYYRMRWTMLSGFDLGRGPTPSTGRPIFPVPPSGEGAINSADMRLRMDLSLEIARSVRVVVRVDALDNLVLGSTPLGFPRDAQVPMIVGTPGQQAPVSGKNALIDSIHLRRAYGEVLLPIGYLAAGRMGALTPWGMGIAVHAGDDLDADASDTGDRVVLALVLFGHMLMAAYDWSASGPVFAVPGGYFIDLEPRDNVCSYALAFARYDSKESVGRLLRGGRTVINYGLLFSYREQQLDVPSRYVSPPSDAPLQSSEFVERDAWSVLASAWFLLRTRWLRIELEALYVQGEIANGSMMPGIRLTKPLTSQQFGGVLQVALAPPKGRWGVGVEFGLASGDEAPGLGVNAAPGQVRTQPGDLDGPQLQYPQDTTANNLRFHSNYRVDQIFWRRIVGQITDAIYWKAAAHVDATQRLRLWTSALYSRAMFASSLPGGVADIGVEWDVGLRYDYDPGFEVRFTLGLFFPLAGLRNQTLDLDPTPALASHLVLGYVF